MILFDLIGQSMIFALSHYGPLSEEDESEDMFEAGATNLTTI